MTERYIAVAGPLTGPSQLLGAEMAQAVRLAVDEHCHDDLALETFDDQGDIREGERLARALARDARCVGVVGHYNSDITLAAAPIYDAARLPLIAPIVSNPALTERGMTHIFRFTNRDDRTADAIAGHLYQRLGKRTAAVVATRTTYGTSMAGEFERAFTALGGRVPGRYEVDEGQKTFPELPREADVIFYGGTFEGAPLVRHIREQGSPRLLATGDGCWDLANFLRPAGPAATEGEGTLVLSATPQLGEVKGSSQFARRYERRYGSINNYAANSYDAACMLLNSVAIAGDREETTAALRGQRFEGIAYGSPSAWDDRGDNLATVTALHEVNNGRFRQVAEYPATAPE
ncbi:branched-chain amino acid ABC transporter substrate-binding protein [Nonomuraea sp. CA-141351]|uniref:branched-chain amino acid ABC transporter substrate-binding protein n=1 Tax=Nonomuraea sp. CA-141351 TaxID=3239996 RepID=UPI003D8C13AA